VERFLGDAIEVGGHVAILDGDAVAAAADEAGITIVGRSV
jgi:hypothetical protein